MGLQPLSDPVLDPDGLGAEWTLGGTLESDFYAIRLNGIMGVNNQPFNGEWVNPTTLGTPEASPPLESGDAVAGGEFQFVFTQLEADFNLDNLVDLLDLDVLGTNFGLSPADFGDGDADGDGDVDLNDLDILGVDFNAVLTALTLLYDYDGNLPAGNLVIGASDQDEFAMRLATGTDLSTDLNADGDYTDADQAIFDLYFHGLNLT